jgi:hypothetical protein
MGVGEKEKQQKVVEAKRGRGEKRGGERRERDKVRSRLKREDVQ